MIWGRSNFKKPSYRDLAVLKTANDADPTSKGCPDCIDLNLDAPKHITKISLIHSTDSKHLHIAHASTICLNHLPPRIEGVHKYRQISKQCKHLSATVLLAIDID